MPSGLSQASLASVLLLLLWAIACGTASPDVEVLLERERALGAVFSEKNFEQFKAFWDEDAIVFPYTSEIARGIPAIEEIWRPFFENPDTALLWTPEGGEMARSGDLGITFGHFTLQDGDHVTAATTGKYLTVWRKLPGGEWRVLADVGNFDQIR